MFKLNKRTNSISISDGDRESINSQIDSFYQKLSIAGKPTDKIDNISKLFKALLEHAAGTVEPEYSHQVTSHSIESFDENEKHAVLMEKIELFKSRIPGVNKETVDTPSALQIALDTCIDYDSSNLISSHQDSDKHAYLLMLLDKVREKLGDQVAVDAQIIEHALNETLKEHTPTEIEKEVIKEVEKPRGANEIRYTLTENERILITEIANRRFGRKKSPELESLDDLAKKLAFNDGSIFNLSGEFFTGVHWKR